jgi:hypothetical protein
VEVEASQDVAKDLGILDKLSFGDSFAAIREALGVKDEWKTRFDAADAAKAAEAAKTVEVDEEMEVDDGVDEESVLSGSKKGKGLRARNHARDRGGRRSGKCSYVWLVQSC